MVDVKYKHRLVHLDLKGAIPRISFLEKFFPLISSWGATGVLIEYEDSFPYGENLAILKCPSAFTVQQLSSVQSLCKRNNLEIFPLIQTFGHLEFVLKHDEFRHFREVDLYPNALCPFHPNAFDLIMSLIDAVVQSHPMSNYLHIGADEVWHLGKCRKCQREMDSRGWNLADLFLSWINKIAKSTKEKYPDLKLIMWDDMMRVISVEKLNVGKYDSTALHWLGPHRRSNPALVHIYNDEANFTHTYEISNFINVVFNEFEMGKLVEPMIWKYEASNFNLPSGMFDTYAKVFDKIWVASNFKGATGSTQFLPPIQHHIDNQLTWLSVLKQQQSQFREIRGIAVTGWQRYDHYAVLCELLPVAIPCLALCLRVLKNESFLLEDHQAVSQELGFQNRINVYPFPRPQILEQGMMFPGHEIYVAVQMWSNFVHKYQIICNSEGMLGWFSDYLRSRNFTNPAQVETIMYQLIELEGNLLELQERMELSLLEIFYKDTAEEWIGCFFKPLLLRIKNIIDDCKFQIKLGGRTKDYKPCKIMMENQ